jgi:isopenicillin N synthase-like dioxygenase
MTEIRAVDIQPLFDRGTRACGASVAALDRAWRDIGFVYVEGHGIEMSLIREMRQLCQALFALGPDEKRRLSIAQDNYRGFIPLGFFNANHGGEPETTDLYEGYKLHWDCPVGDPVRDECALYGSNRWPASLSGMELLVRRYWTACDRLTEALLFALASALQTDSVVLKDAFCKPLTNMTLLHYPDQPPLQAGYGIHPHKDTCAFTILYPDPVGGLDVRDRDGQWIEVQCPPESLLVNVGDMVEIWSGGRFVSTPHRVVNRTGTRRYSFPYFAVPRHDVVVQPLTTAVSGFQRDPVPVGQVSAEVWRTNWRNERPSSAGYDLGTLMDQ